jgi:hypothetical protein
MSDHYRRFQELQPLVDEMLDGLISRENMDFLDRILDGNAELQKLVLDYCQVHLSLHCDVRSKKVVDGFADRQHTLPQVLTTAIPPNGYQTTFPITSLGPGEHGLTRESSALPSSQPTPLVGDPFGSKVWPLILMFCFGAAAALVGTFAFRRDPTPANSSLAVPAAFLTSNTGCAWGAESLQLHSVGSTVEFGDEISLQQGIAEFRLANGVYFSVEGPAGLVLISPDAMVLQYGKLTTHVPWPVAEFRVSAGACRLAATDAEFGVSVTGGRVDTHVFSGEVTASNALTPKPARVDEDKADVSVQNRVNNLLTNAVISQGRAMVVMNHNGQLKIARWEKATPSLFATKLTMAGPLPISTAYCDVVKASRPLGYWRFETVEDGAVPNEILDEPGLKIMGDLRLSGLSGNRVAEFRPGSDCYLVSRGAFDALANTEYTAEVWIKPSHIHCGAALSLCTGAETTRQERCALLLEIEGSVNQQVRTSFSTDHPCSIRFLHRDPPDRSRKIGSSCFSKRSYSIRRWQHVVAVKKAEQMELYVDGKLSATMTDKTLLAVGLQMIVGRQEPAGSDIQFIGQLDEIAVYPRALDPQEIKTHYEAVDWKDIKKAENEPKDT